MMVQGRILRREPPRRGLSAPDDLSTGPTELDVGPWGFASTGKQVPVSVQRYNHPCFSIGKVVNFSLDKDNPRRVYTLDERSSL